MTSYIDTPACQLLDTRCACCALLLVDAKSIELCIGPHCRRRYGFNEDPSKPDWYAGKTIAANFDPSLPVETWTDARVACNALVKLFAQDVMNRKWIPEAVYALGYQKLSEKMAERGGRVEVRFDATSKTFAIKAPRNEGFISSAYANVPGRYWDRRRRAYIVPASFRPLLWTSIQTYFAGLLLVTNKGISTIPPLDTNTNDTHPIP